MLDFDHFFKLSSSGGDNFFRVVRKSNITGNDMKRLFRGEITLDKSLPFVEARDGPVGDLIGTSTVAHHLLSEKIFKRFEKEGFTGWSSYPVHITRKDGTLLKSYRGLSISGKCGPRDLERAVPFEKIWRKGGKGQPYIKGLFFDPATYDGSDLFMLEGKYYICVTERVRDALVDLKATNIELTSLPEVTTPIVG